MFETLLLLACLGGTEKSCMMSGDAYQKYSGIEKMVEQYGKEHPILAQTVGAIGLAKEKRVYFQVQGPWFAEFSVERNIAWFKKEF